MKGNITYYLDDTAERFPEKTAFSDEKKEITFRQLRNGALRIAGELVRRKIFKKPVAVYLDKGVDVITSFMGAAYSVNFYSPIDTGMPEARINRILSVLQPAIVITSPALKEAFSAFDYEGEFLLIDDRLYEDDTEEKTDTNVILEQRSRGIDTDLLYVLFTSGSTGIPKGVTINHRAVIDYSDWVIETFSVTEEDSFGNQAPFYFDNSILDIYSTIRTGATCHIIPGSLFSQPVPLLEFLKEKKINTIFWVPSALIVVAKLKAFRNVDLTGTLKRVLFCGEVMPNKQLNIWRHYLPDALYANLYGPTEITDACTYYIVDREFTDEEPLPIGYAMANTDIIVLDEENKAVTESGKVGELCVRGTSLSMGYYSNPEKTAEAFVQNPQNPFVPETIYRTGDLVKYNERGELLYLSRKDFQIKHMGHRIELGEIETAVSSLEEVNLNCCLYDEEKKKIVLFLDADLDRSAVNKRISKLVPEYMLPNRVVYMETMPVNANGKIDRVKLKEYL
ncbi:MAG: amino acid adenylation domain-containing protein [Lachnospiraceae bacterium]|nr:amino acid adenylation domain-containing protein [Lachnospiraceae bacterium]